MPYYMYIISIFFRNYNNAYTFLIVSIVYLLWLLQWGGRGGGGLRGASLVEWDDKPWETKDPVAEAAKAHEARAKAEEASRALEAAAGGRSEGAGGPAAQVEVHLSRSDTNHGSTCWRSVLNLVRRSITI
jgi:hypothetical protein